MKGSTLLLIIVAVLVLGAIACFAIGSPDNDDSHELFRDVAVYEYYGYRGQVSDWDVDVSEVLYCDGFRRYSVYLTLESDTATSVVKGWDEDGDSEWDKIRFDMYHHAPSELFPAKLTKSWLWPDDMDRGHDPYLGEVIRAQQLLDQGMAAVHNKEHKD